MNNPAIWYNVPLIYLRRGNDSIRKLINIDLKSKYAPYFHFLTKMEIIN